MNTPKIRFKGFTDDWEQRKLGDVFKEYSEKHHEELPALTIVQGGGTIFREESDRSLQYDKSNLSGYKMVKKDDFIVHLRSFEGGLEKANSDGIISPAYHTMHGDNVDSRFYYPYFRSYDFINRKLVAHVYGIRDGRSIDIDGMKSIEIPYTSYEEQKTIGDYLDSLDHLITLHQRKCDETKQLKKFMLQKMFPKNGEKNPKIRFEGFTDDWGQRKSGQIAPLRGGYAFKSNEYCSDGIPIVRISNILSDGSVGADFAYYDEQDTDEIYTLYDGAVVLAMSGATTGKVSVLCDEKGQKYYQNQRVGYFIPTDICDYKFVKTIMRSRLFADQLSAVLVAGAQPNVSSKEIDGFKFLIPQSKNEQKKIGEYFSTLDNLITLHQRKCEKLKELKKYMLHNTFV